MTILIAPDIPDHFRVEAIALGLPDELVGVKWIEHCAWMDTQQPGRHYGGAPWSRFVRSVVADLAERKTKDELREQRAAREHAAEASRKREANLLYRQQAITLDEWLETLRVRQRAGDTTLKPHELRLLEYPRLDGDGIGEWLIEALAPQPDNVRAIR
jgi:hypothetical protein